MEKNIFGVGWELGNYCYTMTIRIACTLLDKLLSCQWRFYGLEFEIVSIYCRVGSRPLKQKRKVGWYYLKLSRLSSLTNGIPIRILIIEMISVIVAVSLGFLVTEWREGRQNTHRSALAVDNIITEIQKNRSQLDVRIPYYKVMVATLDSIATIHEDEPFDVAVVPGWRGLFTPILRRASYEVAFSTGTFSYIEFWKADSIAQVYLLQEMVMDANRWAQQSVLSGEVDTWADVQRIFVSTYEISKACLDIYTLILEELAPADVLQVK